MFLTDLAPHSSLPSSYIAHSCSRPGMVRKASIPLSSHTKYIHPGQRGKRSSFPSCKEGNARRLPSKSIAIVITSTQHMHWRTNITYEKPNSMEKSQERLSNGFGPWHFPGPIYGVHQWASFAAKIRWWALRCRLRAGFVARIRVSGLAVRIRVPGLAVRIRVPDFTVRISGLALRYGSVA